jgi:arylformamidase
VAERDGQGFRLARGLFVHAGAHLAVVDFALVQDVGGSLMPMADQVRRAVAWVSRNARSFGGDPDRLYVSGHSSGAHLAAVILTTDWPRDFGLPADTVKGGLCCSGMYDLKPVRLSARSAYVKFTDEMEQALSPRQPVRPPRPRRPGADEARAGVSWWPSLLVRLSS